MSKQRPNPDKMANELAGASAFFRPQITTPTPQPTPEPIPDNQAQSDVVTSRRNDTTTSPIPAAPQPSPQPQSFDLNRPTASRDSLRLSVDETRALDALRQSLKWDHDLTVSKNDICRAALHWLLEDFAAKGEKSAAVARLKRKHTSR